MIRVFKLSQCYIIALYRWNVLCCAGDSKINIQLEVTMALLKARIFFLIFFFFKREERVWVMFYKHSQLWPNYLATLQGQTSKRLLKVAIVLRGTRHKYSSCIFIFDYIQMKKPFSAVLKSHSVLHWSARWNFLLHMFFPFSLLFPKCPVNLFKVTLKLL